MNQQPWCIGPRSFDVKEENCATEWKRWLRSFEFFATASGISDESKHNWLLHYAGPQVQEIFDNLPDSPTETKPTVTTGRIEFQVENDEDENNENDHDNEYSRTVAKLTDHFAPKQNKSYERHIFRKMSQGKNERIDSFAIRLREQANRCEFGNQKDENIKDQITAACHSDLLRRKILERGDHDLNSVMKLGRILESVSNQQKSFVNDAKPPSDGLDDKSEVCEIRTRTAFKRKYFDKTQSNHKRDECSRCGLNGHKSDDMKCPAKGKKCLKCGKLDHFSKKCFTKNANQPPTKFKRESVRLVDTYNDNKYDDYDDVFIIDNDGVFHNSNGENNDNTMWCKIGGVELQFVIDSGTRRNIIDRESWSDLKTKHIATTWRRKEVDAGFTSYGGHRLQFLGMFEAKIEIGDKQSMESFYVADEIGKCLLGYVTAKRLGILKIGINVNNVTDETTGKLSTIKGISVEIPMKDNCKPVQQPYRRIPAPLEKAVDEKISKMLRQDIIEKVNVSKWISPLVITPKPNNDVRVCVDMRRVNEAVAREHHPLPTIENFLPQLENAKFFSKLDIEQAFHQVEISENSREITTFITKRGLFRYKRLMFGINCAPEIFQKIMEQILNGCDGTLNASDDIIVYGNTKKEHDERLDRVLNRLKQFNVTLNFNKCVFGATEIDFLGHHLSTDGIRPMSSKISAVKEFRDPRTTEEVRSFLGLVNYVGKFIPNLATTAEPLSKLNRKGAHFRWEDEQKDAFEKLKNQLTSDTVLGYYNVNDRTQIIADASPVGLGAVLIQFKECGPRIIAYASRSLTKIERKYSQPEKEALALVWAVERFHFYIFGREFELVSDHKSLEALFSPKSKPCARIERWVLRLQSNKYKAVFKPGKSNIADPLSRLIRETDDINAIDGDRDDESYINWIVMHATPKAIPIERIEIDSLADKTIESVKRATDTNDWSDELTTPFKHFATEFCFARNILLRGSRIVMPECLRNQKLELAHEGHPGMSVMKRRIRAKVWWPRIDTHVEDFVKKCKGCSLVGAPSPPEPLSRRSLPSAAWEHLAIDHMGPLPSNHYLLVVVDYYSRYKEVEIVTSTDANQTIRKLKMMFARFGFPLSMQADNGPPFNSHEFETFCNDNNIHLNNGTPYWPQQNGEVERQNRSLLKRLKISQLEKRNWQDDLQDYLLMYRSTQHSTTMMTPAEMMFSRNIRDKLPSIRAPRSENDEEVRDRDTEMKNKGKQYADTKRHAEPNEIREGDNVVLKRQKPTNKLSSTFEPTTYTVKERKGSEIVVENPETETEYRRNVAHAKKIPTGGFRTTEDNPTDAIPNVPDAIPTAETANDHENPDQNQRPKSTRVRGAPKRYGFE
ncbi:uncharacterized protein K02A2.6-like [Bradysia coprophila]|uniref:uncharacterized protein K02A2.6-like n=1 Tax=Bradysia coprophila TaxID=38358 RepID=UPI00187D9D4F|nr:uncharacterized protein K02A2.6-like [Bradysia coprophila]